MLLPIARDIACAQQHVAVEKIMDRASALPRIAIHSHDYNRLVVSAELARRLGSPHARFLLAELRRADLCRYEDLPSDVISMGSRVTYRLPTVAQALTRTLVFDHEADRYPGRLSVATPEGTALLGLRVGDRMPFETLDGQASEVIVERVEPPSDRFRKKNSGGNSKEDLDRRLDRALEETFPASDPISVVCD